VKWPEKAKLPKMLYMASTRANTPVTIVPKPRGSSKKRSQEPSRVGPYATVSTHDQQTIPLLTAALELELTLESMQRMGQSIAVPTSQRGLTAFTRRPGPLPRRTTDPPETNGGCT